MKPNTDRSPVHPPRPRMHSWAQAPLRFSFREVVAQAKRDHGKEVSWIVMTFCLAAACVVAALGFRGYLP